jgi:hypothetical protein
LWFFVLFVVKIPPAHRAFHFQAIRYHIGVSTY